MDDLETYYIELMADIRDLIDTNLYPIITGLLEITNPFQLGTSYTGLTGKNYDEIYCLKDVGEWELLLTMSDVSSPYCGYGILEYGLFNGKPVVTIQDASPLGVFYKKDIDDFREDDLNTAISVED